MIHLPCLRGLPAASALVLLLASSGCDDNTITGGTVDCTKYSQVGQNGTCPNLCSVANDAMCGDSAVPLDCESVPPKAGVEVCGVPLRAPLQNQAPLELLRSSDVEEFGGSGAPDVGCMFPEGFPAPPGTPQTVTMTGIVKVFKNGCQSNDVKVEVRQVVRSGGADDGMPGDLVGEAFVTPSDCMATGVQEEVDLCPSGRYECTFSYPGVPTETELMVVTSGAQWQTIYEYNVYFSNAEVSGGEVDKDVRALKKSDYPVIAQAAMGKTITPGNGALGGEVHDCGDVRLIHAVVDINVPAFVLSYFGDDEDDPLPSQDASATGRTALYTALDIKPGPVAVAAAGVKDGALVGLGYFRAQVFPDAVTSVTFRGLRPFQLP